MQFRDGAQVSKISLPADFSAVHIDNLPLFSNKADISAAIAKIGLQVPVECIRLTRPDGATSSNADIRVEDPLFAKALSAGVRSFQELSVGYRFVEIQIIPAIMPMAAASRRTIITKVYISWHKITRPIWLNFGNGDIAGRVSGKFNKGTYKVLGQSVIANAPVHSSSINRKGRNPVDWTVTLQNIPYNATESDIMSSIRLTYDRPRHVEMAKLKLAHDPELIPTYIQSLLDTIGPNQLHFDLHTQGRRCKGTARFQEDTDAWKAVHSLGDKPQSFLGDGKLTLEIVSSAKFKVPSNLYEAVGDQFTALISRWTMRQVHFKVYRNTDSLRRFTVLRLEGNQVKEVASAANEVETILAGKIIEKDGTALWCESMSQNGETYQRLRGALTDLGVLIIRDKSRRMMKFFGPQRLYGQALELALRIVDTDSTAGKRNESSTTTKQDSDCSICWTEAENAVLTSCEHLYCLGCFEDLCMSGGSTEKEFVAKCQGDTGRCNHIFSLFELEDHLSSAAIDNILEASFTTYVRGHPQDFRYCPTPDCGNIYRTSIESVTQTCSKCLEIICRACHKQHGILTCAEFKAYKRERGIKDCPKCSTPMEKTEGCNHMTCGGCGAHICWVCLKVFDTSGPCYHHMNSVHGGIGLDDLLVEQ